MSGMRTLPLVLYGGSFNPPHLGHTAAARTLWEALSPCRVVIMPALCPPHKTPPEGTPPAKHRLKLCHLAFKAIPYTEVSDYEMLSGASGYTIDTLRHLQREHPRAEITLAVGPDMLVTLDKWKEGPALLREFSIAALGREPGQDKLLQDAKARLERDFGAQVRLIPHTPVAVSSTQAREALRNGGGEGLVPEAALLYIWESGLYV